MQICDKIRPGFLRHTPFLKDNKDTTVWVNDELLLIKSIDSKAIVNWDDFEYVLSVVVENRILKVFVAH